MATFLVVMGPLLKITLLIGYAITRSHSETIAGWISLTQGLTNALYLALVAWTLARLQIRIRDGDAEVRIEVNGGPLNQRLLGN
jgi:hypothetical protein